MDNKHTKEYMEKLGNLTLSDSARERISGELDAYADMHSVREAEAGRSSDSVSQTSAWYTLLFTAKATTMPFIAIAAVIILGGGTSIAAQGSLPGDVLYPVKTNFNENVRSVLALSADAEAELQAEILEERVAEAEELEAEGRLNGQLENEVKSSIATQYQIASMANAEADVDTDGVMSISLGRLATLLSNNHVAMEKGGSATMSSEAQMDTRMMAYDGADDGDYAEESVAANADMMVSTELALEPINVAQLMEQTEARIKSLRDVLERYKNDFEAGVYAEFTATLNEADDMMIQVMVQSNSDLAREYAYQASDLVGKVEAALSTMGTVKIDTDTGAIVDIKLGVMPVIDEPDYQVDPMPMPLPMPPEYGDVDYGDDPDVDMLIETESSLEATSGLSL